MSSPVVSPKISLFTPKPLVIHAGRLFRPRFAAPEPDSPVSSVNFRFQDLPSAGSDAPAEGSAAPGAGGVLPSAEGSLPALPSPLPPVGGRDSLPRSPRDRERRLREGLRRLREGLRRLLDRDRRLRERERLPLDRLDRERLRLEPDRLRLEDDRFLDLDFFLDLDLDLFFDFDLDLERFLDRDFERLSLSFSSFSLPSPSFASLLLSASLAFAAGSLLALPLDPSSAAFPAGFSAEALALAPGTGEAWGASAVTGAA